MKYAECGGIARASPFSETRVRGSAGTTLEPLQWLVESSGFGRSHVYSVEVLDTVDASRRAGAEKAETVDLPEAYLKAAGALAQERAAFAAHRLAAVLREDLD